MSISIISDDCLKNHLKYLIMSFDKSLSSFFSLAVFALTIFGLVYGKALLVPLALAIMVWFLLNALAKFIERLNYKKWIFPHWLSLTIALIVMLGLLAIVVEMISRNIGEVINTAPTYQKNIEALLKTFLQSFGLSNLPSIIELAKQVDVTTALSKLAGSLTIIAGNTGIIFIYVIFLLLEQRSLESKLDSLFKESERRKKVHNILGEIQRDIETYIAIKTLLSVTTGFLSYIILIFLGVDYSEFWAFLIFLLNYIPTVGSLIATIFPALLALIQFESFTYFLIVFVSIALIQFIIGNIIEPRLMGRSLNLSALVVLFSLALWGSIWGVVGMFLCVPITVILMIIFSNFEKTRPIAVLLSSNGKIDKKLNNQQKLEPST